MNIYQQVQTQVTSEQDFVYLLYLLKLVSINTVDIVDRSFQEIFLARIAQRRQSHELG